ncbi:hypothetical protein [Sagittula stellata]|uniref:Uncharacterized protein n=1 Tax=Sagittula stellata (strain ATCC 700073 / DSM 11524 / E-37) TaxID=388399 RepID=A3K7S1_SAGS3|nr:hypothetical protein [Sagittula stellata]EBA06693.1 hypothetical protein SSE37_02360 [Sagittula stellata E-37]
MIPDISECITLAKVELQAARQQIAAEISGYPTPISGCDAQFNHLLAQRQKVSAALQALESEPHIPTSREP